MKIINLKSVLAIVLLISLFATSCRDLDWKKDENYNNSIQPPDKVISIAGIKEGMVIGEFGSGYGRLTMPMAKFVGNKGTIYASDIDNRSLKFLEKRCKEAELSNVKTILGNYEDPLFIKESLDMAISSLVYHEIRNPVAYLKNLIPYLKPGAPIVIVDYDPKVNTEESNIGRDWEKEFRDAGLEIIKFEKISDRDVLYLLKPVI